MFSSGCERGIPSDSVTIVTIAGRCLVSPIVRVRSRATHNPRKTERIGKAVTARRCRHHPHSPTTFCRFASPVDQTTLADRSSFTMTQPWTMLGSLRAGANQVRPHHALRPDHSGERNQRLGRALAAVQLHKRVAIIAPPKSEDIISLAGLREAAMLLTSFRDRERSTDPMARRRRLTIDQLRQFAREVDAQKPLAVKHNSASEASISLSDQHVFWGLTKLKSAPSPMVRNFCMATRFCWRLACSRSDPTGFRLMARRSLIATKLCRSIASPGQ